MDRLKEKWQKYFKKAQETVATLVGKLKQQLQDLLKRKPIRTTLIIIGLSLIHILLLINMAV